MQYYRLHPSHNYTAAGLACQAALKRHMWNWIFSEIWICIHWMKSIQIRSFFWSVFSRIQSEYRKIRTRKNSVFGHFSHSDLLIEEGICGGVAIINHHTVLSTHFHILNKKNTITRYVKIIVSGIQQKRLEQRILIKETVWCNCRNCNLCKPFLTWKTHIWKTGNRKAITIPKIIFKIYMMKKCKYWVDDNRQ